MADYNIKNIIDLLAETQDLDETNLRKLLLCDDNESLEYLRFRADEVRKKYYGKKVFVRGLIEISNFCRNDCYYCGIRKSNKNIIRYRLNKNDIMLCCDEGYKLGFRTFVLQGGEDNYFNDERLCDIIKEIKNCYPECAVTLSLGERSYESYELMRKAGADRYLLRHETADENHYKKFHPETMSHKNRMECLCNLKKLGYQTGAGFMIGSPYQTVDNIISDLKFMKKLEPEMIGAGPFIPHRETCFGDFKSGDLRLTLKILSIIRLMFPKVLLPSTTALGTVNPMGRELGIMAGCNVLMPNLSPVDFRDKYELYDNKICMGEESAQNIESLRRRIENIGYILDMGRGDVINQQTLLC